MVSMWRSKDDGTDSAKNNREPVGGTDVDERSRLLSQSPQESYLSPDDPAVSPYNLWSIRFLRYCSIIFSILTWIWWILLFVDIFVTPPGMYTRGSGFYSFSFTTLTMSLLIVVLLFFSTPSKSAQIASLSLAVLLLFDTIITLSIYRVRVEEGWIGIMSIIWALFASIWTIFTDRTVSWGKHGEEERLTGRPETRRTLFEWLAVFSSTIVLIAIATVAFLLSCTLILRSCDSLLQTPGKRYYVDSNKYQIHLFCSPHTINSSNTRAPTVLFESGKEAFMYGMIQIADNAISNGSISRYCYSDRPGIGWSDNAPSPFSAGMSADALSEALTQAGEKGPWILVSAGVGSIYSRVFSSRHGRDIKGLLMIDPLHEDLLGYISNPTRNFVLWVKGIMSPLGINQIFGAIFKGRSREDRVYGRSAHQGSKYIKAKLQEALVALSLTKREVQSAKSIQIQNVPLVLISSGIEVTKSKEWEAKQRDLSHLTQNIVSWDIVNKAPSEVWRTEQGRDIIEKRLRDLVNM
ncbi:Uncharacterized protein C23C11.06c [Golovinomyces cichoracearum]|uniref:Uncharacterized protein C23C11.06c n=1 Tax=Golovinomyces cichoracearum TaxID=62708 RepID=A0A420HAY6_9PEZI|nr:Uncharacterized protein C23C11.06c [Golovinomyces cichoracearum]